MTRSLCFLSLSLSLALGACASFSADGGMGEVAQGVGREAGRKAGASVVKISSVEQAERARQRATALLAAGPISADSAAEVALLNNRDLQAAYNDLGLSEAAYVQASLPPNPTASVLRIGGTGVANFEFRLIDDLLSLITLQRRTDIAAERFARARQQAIEATLRLAADARRSYIRAVTAQQQIALLDRTRATVDAATRLYGKLAEAGGGDLLDETELAALYAELSARLGQARLTARRERETLVRLMGLWGGDNSFSLPRELPPLPGEPDTLEAAEIEAIKRRVDLTQARLEVSALAKSLALTNATRFVSMLQLAGIVSNESANPLTNTNTDILRGGGQLDVSLPVFDTGEARLRAAQETYMRALNKLAAKAVNARSEARIAYETYRGTYDIARFWHDRIVPLRRTASREVELRYNNGVLAREGLRVDLFRLLVDARIRISAESTAVDTLRDFHLSVVDLEAALTIGGDGSSGAAIENSAIP